MTKILEQALNSILKEDGEFNESFTLVDKLLLEYGEVDLAERLYSDIDKDWPVKVICDLFGILIWSTSDNGTALTQVTDRWITECICERKVAIAIDLETYPFRSFEEMERKLNVVSSKFPGLSPKCESLIESRRRVGA